MYDSLRDEAGLTLSIQEVRKVLRDNMNMRYRMLKTVEYRGNSERCLYVGDHFRGDLQSVAGDASCSADLQKSVLVIGSAIAAVERVLE